MAGKGGNDKKSYNDVAIGAGDGETAKVLKEILAELRGIREDLMEGRRKDEQKDAEKWSRDGRKDTKTQGIEKPIASDEGSTAAGEWIRDPEISKEARTATAVVVTKGWKRNKVKEREVTKTWVKTKTGREAEVTKMRDESGRFADWWVVDFKDDNIESRELLKSNNESKDEQCKTAVKHGEGKFSITRAFVAIFAAVRRWSPRFASAAAAQHRPRP